MTARAAFAIPGDIRTVTGGYIYERRLLEALRALGRDVRHLQLPAGYPEPSPDEMQTAIAQLASVEPGRVLILDGFVSGATATEGLARIRAPMLAIVHHPLAHETGLMPDRRDHLFRTERDNLALMAHVLVPSPHTARILTAEYGVPADRITVVTPGIDPASGPPEPTQPPLILSVGILHPRKGHDTLIAALDRIRALDWRCVIVGRDWDSGHAAALVRQARVLGLAGRLTLAGQIDDAALARLYRQATLFALATRHEGYGIVFGEALRHGLPIVSCRTGAVPDTVPETAGVLVAPDDPAAFATALASLLTAPDRLSRCREGATAAGAALPDWTGAARRVAGVLDMLAAGQARRQP